LPSLDRRGEKQRMGFLFETARQRGGKKKKSSTRERKKEEKGRSKLCLACAWKKRGMVKSAYDLRSKEKGKKSFSRGGKKGKRRRKSIERTISNSCRRCTEKKKSPSDRRRTCKREARGKERNHGTQSSFSYFGKGERIINPFPFPMKSSGENTQKEGRLGGRKKRDSTIQPHR